MMIRRAWRSLRRLFADPDDTRAVFEIIDALPGRSGERAFRRLSGLPPFTSLLPPGAVAVLCAPRDPGAHHYELSGDVAARGRLLVRGEDA